MSHKRIVYYFSLTSPWAYLGHAMFLDIARRHGVQIDYRPIGLGQVFPTTGGLPLAKRAPARQAYRLVELQRWRVKRGVHVNLHARYFPFDVSGADRAMIAVLESGAGPDDFLLRALRAVFAEDRNLADPVVIAEVLAEAGLNAASLMARAQSAEIAAQYQENIAMALEANAFGSPSYVLDGEVFWGQDRLELLEDALASGRAGYRAG